MRNVRNFWMSARVDGRNTGIASGPTSKDGGMDVTMLVRKDGSVSKGLSLICRNVDGENRILVIDDETGQEVYRKVVSR